MIIIIIIIDRVYSECVTVEEDDEQQVDAHSDENT
jgi:hypothetical protein